jgi:hypothetical protein
MRLLTAGSRLPSVPRAVSKRRAPERRVPVTVPVDTSSSYYLIHAEVGHGSAALTDHQDRFRSHALGALVLDQQPPAFRR